MESPVAGAASGPAWTGLPPGGRPEFVLLVPDDGRVPVHRGMCFLRSSISSAGTASQVR